MAAEVTVRQAYRTFSELNHVFCGLYIWDYFKSIRYEWSYLRRRNKRSWMAWCNTMCRLATLCSVGLLLTLMNLSGPSSCQAIWVTLELLSSLASLCALLIIAHRITLVWPGRRSVRGAVSAAWLVAIAGLLYGLLKAHAAWDSSLAICTVKDTVCLRAPALILLVVDILFLGILLWGCHKLPSIAKIPFRVKLYRLGAAPFVTATLLQLVFTVFAFVDLNDAMNLMFHAPAFIMLSAASTRIHRVLEPYHHGLTPLSRVFVGTSFMSDPEMLFATNPAIIRTVRSSRTASSLAEMDDPEASIPGDFQSSVSPQPLKERSRGLVPSEGYLSKAQLNPACETRYGSSEVASSQ